jgi:hypothetical protein
MGNMDALRDIVEFRSTEFSPVLPEDSQVNPEVYGAELAYWLSLELARRGVATTYPISEDWGWLIEYLPESGSEFAVHCGNVGGARDHWLLSLRRHARKMFGRDKPDYLEAAPLVGAIKALIEGNSRITNVRWLYDDEAQG